MDWSQSKDLVLCFLAVMFIKELHEFRKSVNFRFMEIHRSMQALHDKLIVVIEKTSMHESSLEDHNDRIRALERLKTKIRLDH